MDHTSDLDPTSHSSADLLNDRKERIGKIHIATDPSEQQAARMQ